MAPLIVLVVSAVIFWIAGLAGAKVFHDPSFVLRAALAVMFLLTASAHWGKRRPDLIRMVPPMFPRPGLIVTITGVLEIVGAIGLIVPETARAACIGLAVLLVLMFPANVRASHERMTIAGKQVLGALPRGIIQLVFIAALIAATWIH